MAIEDSFVVDRRLKPRLPVTSSARLRPNDWSTAHIDMVDISAEGFRGAGELLFRIGSYVSLQIPGIGWVEALIVWTHPGQFGARFLFPIDLDCCGWTSHAGKLRDPLVRKLAAHATGELRNGTSH
ncbi:MAG: hypothetical protein JWP15_3091 [Alphaproteobacteria bacterium]|nr:hypothetical protein [Alphaproteobacteria bacterium]